MQRKTVALPGYHDIDIFPILSIVDSKLFQRLHHRKQLGFGNLVFPSANHTRFEHSLGVYALTLERTGHWVKDGFITADEAWNLTLYGLLHDIGHGPYSHASEGMCSIDHNQHGLNILEQLQKEIENSNGDINFIRQLFKKEHPLKVGVSHRPFGTDKLDYLKRDSQNTMETSGFRLGDILNYTDYRDQEMVINAKFIPEALQLEQDYVNMHDRVYFRKAAVILQSFLRQIIWYALQDGSTTAEQLLNMRDNELDSLLMQNRNPIVKQLFNRLFDRELPKTAIALRPEETLPLNHTHRKARVTFRIPLEQLKAFSCCEHREIATQHEHAIAAIANLPPEAILITPVASPERFIPHDIRVFNGEETVRTLHEHRPSHRINLIKSSIAYAAVRVCTFEEYRERLSQNTVANQVYEYLMRIPSA